MYYRRRVHSEKKGSGGGYSLEGAAVLRAGLCTSGTASWGVTTLYPKLVHHCKTHIVHIMVLLDQRNWGLMFVASFVFVYTMFWEDFSTLPNRLELKHLVSFSHLLSCQTFWGFHFPWSGFLPAFWKPGLSWPPVRQGLVSRPLYPPFNCPACGLPHFSTLNKITQV